MKGKLFGLGVGPGDPELLTVKALRLIKEATSLQFRGMILKKALRTRL